MKRLPMLVSFVLFIALCASVTFWGMQLFKSKARTMVAPPIVQPVRLDAALALFGGHAAIVAVLSNFQLKGVIVSDNPAESVAILGADGKAAQSIAVNAEVVPGVTVKEVFAKYILLSQNGATQRVELPEGAQSQLKINAVTNDAPPPPLGQMNQVPPAPPSMATTPMAAPQSNAPAGVLPPGMQKR